MDAQADLSLRWVHSHLVGFVTRRLTYGTNSSPFQTGEMEVRNPLFTGDAQTPVNGQSGVVNGVPEEKKQ